MVSALRGFSGLTVLTVMLTGLTSLVDLVDLVAIIIIPYLVLNKCFIAQLLGETQFPAWQRPVSPRVDPGKGAC